MNNTLKQKGYLAPDGVLYPSFNVYCRKVGVNPKTATARIRRGVPENVVFQTTAMNDVLTVPDHTGKMFRSVNAMCKAWNVSANLYRARLKMGWSQEKALTTPAKGSVYKYDDGMGHKFKTVKEASKFYGVNVRTVKARLRKGIAFGDAVSEPVKSFLFIPFTDHNGNHWISGRKMCSHYDISYTSYKKRLLTGMTANEALVDALRSRRAKPDTCVGEHNQSICGLDMHISGYEGKEDGLNKYSVTFESGETVTGVTYGRFRYGNVMHPTLSHVPDTFGSFKTFTTKCLGNTRAGRMYDVVCKKCGFKETISVKQMLEHKCVKEELP